MKSSITSKGLCVALSGREIIHDVELEIASGEVTVLIGPNGAGKSTLMKAMLGLNEKYSGSILFDGINTADIKPAELAAQIGYLGQNIKPEWNMAVVDLIALGRLPHQELGITTKSQDETAINVALQALEMEHLRNRKIDSISGGELALVLLARILAGKPKYVFADEPLNHLDVAHQMQLIKALQTFTKNGGGVFAIVHDLTMAARLGDKFALMANGKIMAHGDRQILNPKKLAETFGVEIALAKFNGQTIFVVK